MPKCFFPSLRDVLPFTLKLPEAIASAKTQTELEEVAQLGAGNLMGPVCVCVCVNCFCLYVDGGDIVLLLSSYFT